ncbi:putative bifunctional diguanylate cyclase/phosphodiesterase [Sphingomonas xinjiangensis]|uniref:Diguanylate cyclase (GGDEF)-like protein n=1 Tax=Sphingomonas xinjiangensis TaxID=643568 RepID=A0A840Y9M0_9SPHN|nr:EAL domain-containing protein [Sphingomonas xinjiangensis]MBB5708995.1 diguanylate cyclase (GGDEF)-like protein [Sphingomonas xinjiangensis]
MTRRLVSAIIPASAESSEILLEQFRGLRGQVPLMYALIMVDAAFLGFASHDSVAYGWSLGMPLLLALASAVRAVYWLRLRRADPSPKQVRRYLITTTVVAGLLSLGFGGWGMYLYVEADLLRRACIALYVFIGAICCCYCLQSLPRAAYLVLLCGAAPITFCMVLSESWFMRGMGMNMVLVSVVIVRMLRTNFAGLLEVLRSRQEMASEQRRAQGAEQRAYQLAYHDPLTGLPNRRALAEALAMRLQGDEPRRPFGLLIVDLDRFKAVNDVHGHPVGDRLLHDVADRLADTIAGNGQSYRIGGDEFAIVLEGGRDVAHRLSQAIVHQVGRPFTCGKRAHHIGASVGMALFPDDGDDRETLMRRADIALYKAKEEGRGRHCAFEPSLDAEIRRRSAIEIEIREALERDAFVPFYQPVVELRSGVVVGYELLARWPRHGAAIGPDQFIPIAEECGLIDDLMLRLLRRAFRETRDWGTMLAVNVSPNQLRDGWFAQKVLALLAREGFPAHKLVVEITENALITDGQSARDAIAELKTQGIKLALDDFGTGYSSLQHLQMLPFDKIKIDRSFVTTMDRDPQAQRLVEAIVALTRKLDLPVIAEGVESAAAARALAVMGCTYGQGYHFGRPMAAGEVEATWRALSSRSGLSELSRLRAG